MAVTTTINPGPRSTALDGLAEAIESHPIWTELRGPVIFYTAITRARQQLRIYWSPETQQAVISGLHATDTRKDVTLLSARRDLVPIRGR